MLILDQLEKGHNGSIFDVPVTTRLVPLVAREPGSSGRGIGLYGIPLVTQIIVEKPFQQEPDSFNVFVIIRDIGIIHVDPVTHPVGQILPLPRIFHYFPAADLVVF